MAEHSNIEWTDASWTPIRARNKATGKVGWHCEHATPGCEFCYAEGMNKRLGTGLPFKPGHRKDIELFLDEKMLTEPLRWRKPRMVFVCSMTDLFADFVPDAWIDQMFAVMALAPQHTFQVLTKRPARMRDHMSYADVCPRIAAAMTSMGFQNTGEALRHHWPLSNIWLGTSAEDQDRADERIPLLLDTPAAVRFASLEPLLGPIDLEPWLPWPPDAPDVNDKAWGCQECDGDRGCDCPNGKAVYRATEFGQFDEEGAPTRVDEQRIVLDQLIVGGESGKRARPMHPDWARALRDQCVAAGVPFFFKQWGEWIGGEVYRVGDSLGHAKHQDGLEHGGKESHWWSGDARGGVISTRVGKKRAGRLLDGREWSEFPTKVAAMESPNDR